MTARCTVTELPVDGCAHCRPAPARDEPVEAVSMKARYAGQCPACGGRIVRGDQLVKCDERHVFVHDGCQS